MAISIINSVTLDESLGLQNALSIPAGDANDNDIAYASLNATFSARLGVLGLSSVFSTANGAATNTVATLSGGSTLSGFVKDNGDPLPVFTLGNPPPAGAVATSFTTLDGEAIFLCIDSAAGLGDNLVFGVDASGDVVFTAYIFNDGLNVNVSMVQYEAIDNPDTDNHDDFVDLTGILDVAISSPRIFDFDDLPSGNNLFGVVGDLEAAIVVIGKTIALNANNTFTNASNTINTAGVSTMRATSKLVNPAEK